MTDAGMMTSNTSLYSNTSKRDTCSSWTPPLRRISRAPWEECALDKNALSIDSPLCEKKIRSFVLNNCLDTIVRQMLQHDYLVSLRFILMQFAVHQHFERIFCFLCNCQHVGRVVGRCLLAPTQLHLYQYSLIPTYTLLPMNKLLPGMFA